MFITKHTMKFEYANISQETVHWKNIYQYIESEQYWLIHISPHLMHIVLKSAFSAEEKQQFSAMLKQNIGERSKIDKKMWGK
ncbi:MAG: hypothetical protein CR960_02175 [Pasteurellales bacterium]|nr:MAG: hypothetical protein CR960_02175 [Pasteurellales bacterium]